MVYQIGSLLERITTTVWQRRELFILSAAALTFLARAGVSFAFATYQFDPGRDYWAFGFEWGRIASWLVQTGMFSLDGKVPTADTDPLYVFLIAPFFHIFGIFSVNAAIAIIALQSLFCALSAWAIFVLAEKLYGPLEARVATLIFALYPASIFLAVNRIGPSSLSILLLCLTFLAALKIPGSQGLRWAGLTGFLAGLVVLSSSDNLSLLLVIPAWLVLFASDNRARMVLKSSLVVVVAALVLSPWSVRNSIVSGETTISKANLGYHLYVGNNPGATGYFYTGVPSELADDSSPYKQSQYYSMAFSWISQHPKEFAFLTLKRIQYFWYVIGDRGYSNHELIQSLLLLALLGFAITGLVLSSRGSKKTSLVWLFLAIYPLVFYITHVTFYRRRFHIEPFVLVLASHGLAVLGGILLKRWAHASSSTKLPRLQE